MQPKFFSSYAPQNGQAYVTRPPWNVAGVDYAVGIRSAYAGRLKDPATAPLPTGCAFYGGSMPYVECANVHNLNISGYNFGATPVGAVQLDIKGGVTGTLTISNDKFFNGPTVDKQYYDVIINNSNSANVVMKYDYFNGNGVKIPTGALASIVSDYSTGSLIFQYNAMLDVPSKAIGYAPGNSNVNISYNFGEGLNFGSPVHSEFTIGTTRGSEEVGYNTFLVNNNNEGATANIYLDSGEAGGTVSSARVDHNVLVSNYNPRMKSDTSSYLLEPGGQTFDSINFSDNYFDPNGSYGCIYPAFNANKQTFTGNVDMIDGSRVGGVGGCNYSNGVLPFQSNGVLPSQSLIEAAADAVPSVIPEPSTWTMLLVAFVVLGYPMARRGARGVIEAPYDRV
jgi:hypothetical protein